MTCATFGFWLQYTDSIFLYSIDNHTGRHSMAHQALSSFLEQRIDVLSQVM